MHRLIFRVFSTRRHNHVYHKDMLISYGRRVSHPNSTNKACGLWEISEKRTQSTQYYMRDITSMEFTKQEPKQEKCKTKRIQVAFIEVQNYRVAYRIKHTNKYVRVWSHLKERSFIFKALSERDGTWLNEKKAQFLSHFIESKRRLIYEFDDDSTVLLLNRQSRWSAACWSFSLTFANSAE